MINCILATFSPALMEIMIIFIVFGILVFLVIWFYKLIARNKNENIRLRLEVGKLADELEQIHKKVPTEDDANESSEKSG